MQRNFSATNGATLVSTSPTTVHKIGSTDEWSNGVADKERKEQEKENELGAEKSREKQRYSDNKPDCS